MLENKEQKFLNTAGLCVSNGAIGTMLVVVLLVFSVFLVGDNGLARNDRLVVTEAAVQGLRSRDEGALALSGTANWNRWERKRLEGKSGSERLEVLDLTPFASESLCNFTKKKSYRQKCLQLVRKTIQRVSILQFWSMMPQFLQTMFIPRVSDHTTSKCASDYSKRRVMKQF